MSFRSISLAVVAALVAVPLAAQTTAPAPDAPKPKKPRMVCRQDGDTGSHFVKRICHTEAEWAEIAASRRGGPDKDSIDGVRR